MTTPTPRPHQILIVDDDPETIGLLEFFLASQQGCCVRCAETWAEGFRLAVHEAPDLVLLDNWLRDGSGIDFCWALKVLKPDLPVVFCSAVAYEQDKAEARAAGAEEYFTKPFDLDELWGTISRLLPGQASDTQV